MRITCVTIHSLLEANFFECSSISFFIYLILITQFVLNFVSVCADKPPIADLPYFLEFQVSHKVWAPLHNDLRLGPATNSKSNPSSPAIHFSLMGPRLYVNTTQVPLISILKFEFLSEKSIHLILLFMIVRLELEIMPLSQGCACFLRA